MLESSAKKKNIALLSRKVEFKFFFWGIEKKLDIIIDKSLNRFVNIFAAAGHPNCVFKINFNELIKITNGSVKEISE